MFKLVLFKLMVLMLAAIGMGTSPTVLNAQFAASPSLTTDTSKQVLFTDGKYKTKINGYTGILKIQNGKPRSYSFAGSLFHTDFKNGKLELHYAKVNLTRVTPDIIEGSYTYKNKERSIRFTRVQQTEIAENVVDGKISR